MDTVSCLCKWQCHIIMYAALHIDMKRFICIWEIFLHFDTNGTPYYCVVVTPPPQVIQVTRSSDLTVHKYSLGLFHTVNSDILGISHRVTFY